MKLSLILEAVNRMSRPLDQGRKSLDQMAGAAKTSAGAMGVMERRMEGAQRSARGLGRAGETMGDRVAAGARRGSMALVALERRMQLSHATMTKLAVTGASFLGGAIRGGVLAAGAGAAGGLYKIVTAGMQSENFMTQLVGLESGNAAAAKKDMEWIKKFAKDTPYDLAQVTQAFIDARNSGVNPMNGSLMTLSDSAAALGKTFDDAIGMLADARTEQFERMREFGITPNQQGGKVMLRYVDRLGKEMVKIVNKNGADVERATLAILDEKFGGGGAALARTTLGKWNALTDQLSQQAVKVWEGGFGDAVKTQLDRATKAFERAEKDGSANAWTTSVSHGLRDVTNAIGEADWKGFREDVKGVAGAFGQVYRLVTMTTGALSSLRKGMGEIEVGADRYFGGLAWQPMGGLKYQMPDWMNKLGQSGPAAPRAPYKDAASQKRGSQLYWPGTRPQDIPLFGNEPGPPPRTVSPQEWQRALGRPRPDPTLRPPRSVPAPSLMRPAAAPKGEIKVTIKTDRGTTARVTKVAATGVDLEVNTGKALGGFA